MGQGSVRIKELPGSSESVKPMDSDGQDSKGEATKETSGKSVFVNSEPMREEQVQNAVKFLSHPKVRDSPVIYRRSFLEKKGLTKEEIDEAFRRVPDPSPNVSSAPGAAVALSQDGQLKPSSSLQPQVPTQTPQGAAAPGSGVSTVTTLKQSRFHWSHAFYAVGLLAASGAGTALLFKNAVVPRFKAWVRKVATEEDDSEKKDNSKPTLAEEAAAAAKAAALAAADVALVSQQMLNSKNEEKKYFEAFMSVLDSQVEEMKSTGNAIRKLEATREVTPSATKHIKEHVQSASEHVRPSLAPASMEPPKSYMEMMAMAQSGEKPPGMKPWEFGQVQHSSNYGLQSEVRGEGSSFEAQNNGTSSQLSGKPFSSTNDSTEPWWHRKTVKITEIEHERDNLRIASNGTGADERPIQHGWVPPQLPPTAMAEGAAAIRQPKTSIPKEQSSDEQLMIHSDDGNGEMQRIRNGSDHEIEVESSSGVVDRNPSERQEEQEGIIEVN
ncbi:peroxisomal membrane protein PEX14-like isoform X2 [Tasmannia lanceolata]|uniref:peroxisomal membrane protein PEX14-like isoform X2 n=1 Tax=Tasmannia lanceolata TaxID=3420 RepID=UPI00406360A6